VRLNRVERTNSRALPLPMIPHLKITDMGLVDVDNFVFVRD
jgi:adenine deaminase